MDVVRLLGVNVRHQRKLKGMTQEELAAAVMERRYASDLERGTRTRRWLRSVGLRMRSGLSLTCCF